MAQPQQMTIQQALSLAIQHHQAARFAEAEQLYRQILAAQPRNLDAMHLLGTLALHVGRPDAALELFDQAIAAEPNLPQFHCNRGEALSRLKRFDEAIGALEKALALHPDFPEAMNNLGMALHRSGRHEPAIAQFQNAIKLRPAMVPAYYNLTSVLSETGRLEEAIAALRQAVHLQPAHPHALNNLGSLLHQAGHFADAIAAFKQALALRPELPETHFNLGNVLRDEHRWDEAIASFTQAIALRPNFPEAQLNLGLVYQDQQLHAPAIQHYRKALEQRPDFAQARNNLGDRLRIIGKFDEAITQLKLAADALPDSVQVHSNLGNVYQDLGRIDDAIAEYQIAIQIAPENPTAHHNLSLALLLAGRMEEGWPQYEWRRKVRQLAPAQFNLPQPIWDGSDLGGRRILLHAEQGLGDSIHFSRYIPLVAQRGGKVTLACQPELTRLLSPLPGIVELITHGQPLPEFDEHCPLPSLPGRFKTTLATIPALVPYLRADTELSGRFKSALETAVPEKRWKIGIAWSGRSSHHNDHNRSVRLEAFTTILERFPNAAFISLQQGAGAAEIATLPERIRPIDFSADISDFADTAALIDNLDLIITVDTAVAHLAGAMGKTVWVLIPMNPDWRWMLERTDSPWYPTMRLFRQQTFQSWEKPIQRMADALAQFLV